MTCLRFAEWPELFELPSRQQMRRFLSGARLIRLGRQMACAALLLAAPAAAATPTADTSARAFVEHIYNCYTGHDGSDGVRLTGATEVRRLFDPPLATLILADRAKSAKLDEPTALDGDPFVDAQDWVVRDLRIRVTSTGAQSATADVAFVNLDQKVRVRIDLVHLVEGWRITEIHYLDSNTTLSGILQYY